MIRPSVIGNIMGQGNLDRLNHQSFFLFPFFLQRWSRRLDWSRTLSTNYYKTIIRLLSKMGMKKTLQFRRKVLLLFHREESCLEKCCITVEGGWGTSSLQSERACLGCYIPTNFIMCWYILIVICQLFCLLRCHSIVGHQLLCALARMHISSWNQPTAQTPFPICLLIDKQSKRKSWISFSGK